jgi:DNA-binding NtrC family response regulator
VIKQTILPRVLIIDDLFGRIHSDRRNEERASLCGQYLLADVTSDEYTGFEAQEILNPVAEAVFYRGQRPLNSRLGDIVENDLESTLEFVRKGWTDKRQSPWAMVLLDLCFYTGKVTEDSSQRKGLGMPEGRRNDDDPSHYFGLEILKALHNFFPDLPVVILSSKPRAEVSREFSYYGALGFLPREDSNSPELLREYLQRHGLLQDAEIVGQSISLLVALRAARRASETDKNLLLRGETGTGKEEIAKYIHRQRSGPTDAKFTVINSPVFTSELFASELFGIESKVATEVQKRPGLLWLANEGDVFFDEIADMIPRAQAAILRVLEERSITPVGSSTSYPIGIRFLSATNADVETMTSDGRFRRDLLYRLQQGGTILLPPLRTRKEDIPLLVNAFIFQAEAASPKALVREVESAALDKLLSHDWPGNIRELRDCIWQAILQNPDVEHLVPDHIELPVKTHVAHSPVPCSDSTANTSSSIDHLLAVLNSMDFGALEPLEFAGRLQELENAWAGLVARLLKAALETTRRRTAENPQGEALPLPAMKFITGNKGLEPWQAYDIINRILGSADGVADELLSDPAYKSAIEKALKRKKKQSSE